MIIFKTWKKIKYMKNSTYAKTRFIWSGWFLFGIFPLYLRRSNIDNRL